MYNLDLLIVYIDSLTCRGGLDDDAKSTGSLLLLAASVSISWVFAKSIQNASTLGAQYGLVGCVAYGAQDMPTV